MSVPVLLCLQMRYCYDETSMDARPTSRRRFLPVFRAVIEVAFIVFLFYSNLLMGEFTHANGRGKTLAIAVRDIFTHESCDRDDFGDGWVCVVFETLRKRL